MQTTKISPTVELARSTIAHSVQGPRGRVGERIWGWAFAAVDDPEVKTFGAEHNFDLQELIGKSGKYGLFKHLEFIPPISRSFSIPHENF